MVLAFRKPSEVRVQILSLMTQGVSAGAAAQVAGVTYKTVCTWRARGDRVLEQIEETGKLPQDPDDREFATFAWDMRRARAAQKAHHERIIHLAATKDWRAALAFLARQYPDEWAKKPDAPAPSVVGTVNVLVQQAAQNAQEFEGRTEDDVDHYIAYGRWPEDVVRLPPDVQEAPEMPTEAEQPEAPPSPPVPPLRRIEKP